jgi:hypothetical protein
VATARNLQDIVLDADDEVTRPRLEIDRRKEMM